MEDGDSACHPNISMNIQEIRESERERGRERERERERETGLGVRGSGTRRGGGGGGGMGIGAPMTQLYDILHKPVGEAEKGCVTSYKYKHPRKVRREERGKARAAGWASSVNTGRGGGRRMGIWVSLGGVGRIGPSGGPFRGKR
jgi:hypothetical protein